MAASRTEFAHRVCRSRPTDAHIKQKPKRKRRQIGRSATTSAGPRGARPDANMLAPLGQHEKVRVTIEGPQEMVAQAAEEAERIVRRSYGLIGWTGDLETLRRVAEDPELGLLKSP
jgi:hypothetical protein